MRQVETWLREEAERAQQYLEAATAPKLIRVMEDMVLTEHVRTLIDVRPCI